MWLMSVFWRELYLFWWVMHSVQLQCILYNISPDPMLACSTCRFLSILISLFSPADTLLCKGPSMSPSISISMQSWYSAVFRTEVPVLTTHMAQVASHHQSCMITCAVQLVGFPPQSSGLRWFSHPTPGLCMQCLYTCRTQLVHFLHTPNGCVYSV